MSWLNCVRFKITEQIFFLEWVFFHFCPLPIVLPSQHWFCIWRWEEDEQTSIKNSRYWVWFCFSRVKLCGTEGVTLLIQWQLRQRHGRWINMVPAKGPASHSPGCPWNYCNTHKKWKCVQKAWADIVCLLFGFFFLNIWVNFLAENNLFRWLGVKFYSCLMLQTFTQQVNDSEKSLW